MALTYTGPADIDFDPESVDTVITNTFATAPSEAFAAGTGGFASGSVDLSVALLYDQDFITTDATHPDAFAADLTVQAVFTDDEGTPTRTTTANGFSGSIGTLGATGDHTVGFEVTGIEEGCELTIVYTISNNSDDKLGNITAIGVDPVTGLYGCPFQSVEKYQRLNQRLNGRSATTYEFSSFKRMYKDIAKKK